MISIQNKFLFIHVPKTAGNSIQNILKEYSEDEIVFRARHGQDGVERFGVRNRKYNTSKHSTLSDYKAVLDIETYREMYKFAVIRNPWDRMISSYFSPHRGITNWDRTLFIKVLQYTYPLRHYIFENSTLEKSLDSNESGVINLEKKLDDDIDFLIRYEYLNDDFRLVCDKLGIPYSALPHRNRNESNRNHYSSFYDDELKALVQEKFIDEVLHGDYDFKKG